MANYYIATTGDDTTGNGTLGNPWLTPTKAYNSSTTGDTINVAAGTYLGSANYLPNTFTGRTLLGPTPVNGIPTAIFDYNGGTGSTFGLNLCGAGDTTVLKYCTFTNILSGTYGLFTSTSGPTGLVTVTNCVFHNMRVTIGVCQVFGLSIFGYDQRLTINGCLFYDIYGDGSGSVPLVGLNSAGTAGAFNIYNNTFVLNTAGSPLDSALGFFGGYDGGTYIIKNNIIANYQGTTTYLQSQHASTPAGTITYQTNDAYLMTNATSLGGTGNITTDPQFIDSTIGGANFNLRQTSPCIDTGVLV